MKIVHLVTEFHCTLGVVDDAGEIVRRIPMRVEIPKLIASEFAEALRLILEQRGRELDALETEATAGAKGVPGGGAPPRVRSRMERRKKHAC